ncbi:MAG TPA: helix-turn-helix transcriptional regulator [Gammaproteobacteria bacterium]|nr:helix-turn-helix transcriptional regulator [Gammaproteobacteria bacterium]
MNRANAPGDVNRSVVLASISMAKKIGDRVFGPLLYAALVPRFYASKTALQHGTGISYSTIHDWSAGLADPKLEVVRELAAKLGVPWIELLGGGNPAAKLKDHPEWTAAVGEAKRRRAGRLPDYAYDYAGETSGARTPAHLTWSDVYELADFWFNTTTDEELMAAETDAIRAEMAAEDAAVLARIEAGRPQNIVEPTPAEPRTPAGKKRRRT